MIDHLSDEALIAWLEAPGDDDALERHVLSCEQCSARALRLEGLLEALDEIRGLAHAPIQSADAIAALEARGVRVFHATGRAGAEVAAVIAPETDVVVMHLPVRATREDALTLSLLAPNGYAFKTIPARLSGAEEPEVLLACHSIVATSVDALRVRVERTFPGGVEVLLEASFKPLRGR